MITIGRILSPESRQRTDTCPKEISDSGYHQLLSHPRLEMSNPSLTQRPQMASATTLTNTQLHPIPSFAPTSIAPENVAPSQAPTTQPQTPNPTSSSRLLALPLELRVQIYTHTLSLSLSPSLTASSAAAALVTNNHIDTALLLVSRQIYHEARLLPFQINTFVFNNKVSNNGSSSVVRAIGFLQKLLVWQREAIRRVEIGVVGREVVVGCRR